MAWGRQLLMHMFGRPKGILGRLGGVIMARANRDAGAQIIELLNIRPDDKVGRLWARCRHPTAVAAPSHRIRRRGGSVDVIYPYEMAK